MVQTTCGVQQKWTVTGSTKLDSGEIVGFAPKKAFLEQNLHKQQEDLLLQGDLQEDLLLQGDLQEELQLQEDL